MLGGVDRGCVFTSAGESGIAAAFFSLSAAAARGREEREPVKQVERGTVPLQPHLVPSQGSLPAAGLGLCCWGPGREHSAGQQVAPGFAYKARPSLRAWSTPAKPHMCSQVDDIPPTRPRAGQDRPSDKRVGLGQPLSGGPRVWLQES